jgi:hypothetical protein
VQADKNASTLKNESKNETKDESKNVTNLNSQKIEKKNNSSDFNQHKLNSVNSTFKLESETN